MKSIKTLTLAAMLALFAGDLYAAGSHSTPCYFDGKTLNVDSGCTLNVKSGGSTDVSGVVFSTTPSQNPLMQDTVVNVPVASVNAAGGYAFISGVTGRKIYPGMLTIMASGTAASATSIKVLCTSGNLLGTFPIAALTTNVPVTPFSSVGSIIGGVAMTQGCASGDSVLVSNVGSNLTTTTNVYINMPYTVQ